MLQKYNRPLARIFRLLDLGIILLSFGVSYLLVFGIEESRANIPRLEFLLFLLSYLLLWRILARSLNLYRSRRITPFYFEVWDVCKTTFLCTLIASIVGLFVHDMPSCRLFLVYLWSLQTVSLIFFRFVLREILHYIRGRGYNFRQVLIVGRNERSLNIATNILESPEYGLRLLGFIDLPGKNSACKLSGEFNLLGDIGQLERILRENVVDEVFITLPIKSFYSEIEWIISICEKAGIEAKIPTGLFNLRLSRSTISRYGDIAVIDLYTSPKMTWQLVTKRLIDVMVSGVVLILISPIFALISALIKVTSKGTVFFRQKRVGYNGRIFTLLKFRTMVENAEELKNTLLEFNEVSGPVFKIRKDPRVTKVGQFLRKTSMDELPQLINVLMGEMSLVGPRPPLPDEVDQYDLTDRRRLSMKPGITCIWQVNGRSEIPFEKWMELDRQYIDQWSLWLDLKILVKTVPAVLRGSGAA